MLFRKLTAWPDITPFSLAISTVLSLAQFLLLTILSLIHRKLAACEKTVVSACKSSESPYIKAGFHHFNTRSRKRTFTTTSPNGLLRYRRSIEKLAIFSTGNTAQGISLPLGHGSLCVFPGLQVPSMDQRRLPRPFSRLGMISTTKNILHRIMTLYL